VIDTARDADGPALELQPNDWKRWLPWLPSALLVLVALLLIFAWTTYAFATVSGFAWALMVLGLAQCDLTRRKTRLAYLDDRRSGCRLQGRTLDVLAR